MGKMSQQSYGKSSVEAERRQLVLPTEVQISSTEKLTHLLDLER